MIWEGLKWKTRNKGIHVLLVTNINTTGVNSLK